MSRRCEDCGKNFNHRQSLFKHKKKCKRSDSSTSTPLTVLKMQNFSTTDDVTTKHAKLHKIIENADDKTLLSDVDDEKSDDSSVDSMDECEDEEDLFDELLWELLCVKCLKYDWSIYECMQKHLELYYNIEKDDSYQEIMDDVEIEESKGLSFVNALDSAIQKHEHLIEKAAFEYRDETLYWKQEPLNVWKYLAIPCKYRCNWQSISECKCKNDSCSLLRRFRALALTLNAMKIDDLIQNIVKAIEKRMEDISLEDAIDRQLKQREDVIVSKFKIAHQRLEKRGYDEESLLKMFNNKLQ